MRPRAPLSTAPGISPASAAAPSSAGDREQGPIFIGGPDRSGKTLVRRALANHTPVAFSRRTNLWTSHRRYGDLAEPANLQSCLAALADRKQVAALEIDVERLRRDLAAGPATYPRLFQLIHEQYAERAGRRRWGDQTAHIEHLADELLAAHPDARIIQLIRDPREMHAAAREKYGRRARLGVVTAHWTRSADAALRHGSARPDAHRVVRYEDLVAAPEATIRDLCDFIGESYGPSSAAAGTRDAEPISEGHRDRFRVAVDPGDRAFIEAVAGRRMDRLGYRRDPRPSTLAKALAVGRRLPDLAWYAAQRLRDRSPLVPELAGRRLGGSLR